MRKTKNLLSVILFGTIACLLQSLFPTLCVGQGAITLEFADKESGEPVSARIAFTKSAKKLSRPRKILFAGDQWLAEKKFQINPPNGEFEFIVMRGPEFSEIKGGFTIEPRARDTVSVEIPRSINMHMEHWYSGDHLSSLPYHELSRWQMADAVDLAVSTANTNELNPIQSKTMDPIGLRLGTRSRYLEWEYGAVLFHGWRTAGPKSDGPESLKLLEEAKGNNTVTAELIRPWSRDVPLLLASDTIRSVQILSSYNRPGGDDRLMIPKQTVNGILGNVLLMQGKDKTPSKVFAPIDSNEEIRFKDARGVGKLSEYLYWQMLESGLRITPTAGSGFNGNETQVGYNRVYTYSETQPDESSWWQAIARGQTFITNGPLLRASVNGLPPGSVQTSYRSQSISLDIAVSLAVRDPVEYLDVVFNGDTIYSAKLEEHYKRGEFPPIEIDQSGWLVIRIVTEHAKGYRFATTAPFYFVFDGKPRVSRKAVAFFQQWQKAALDNLAESPEQWKLYEPWIDRSNQFWEARLRASNSE